MGLPPDEALAEVIAARAAMEEAERRLSVALRRQRAPAELAAARLALHEAERRLSRVRERMQREADAAPVSVPRSPDTEE